MDRFITRTRREIVPKTTKLSKEKPLKQATILDLKRVVVVEDVQRAKVLLEIENQRPDIILDQLAMLKDKIPSREVLEETRIGLVLNKLRKHRDETVSAQARNIFKHWKTHFKMQQDKPKIEVRCDNKTIKFRQNGRKLLQEALKPSAEAGAFAEGIERCVYESNSNVHGLYSKHMRGLVLLLRNDTKVKEELLTLKITIPEFCELKACKKKSR